MTKPNYDVLVSPTLETLLAVVNEAMREGYEPLGPVIECGIVGVGQAVILPVALRPSTTALKRRSKTRSRRRSTKK